MQPPNFQKKYLFIENLLLQFVLYHATIIVYRYDRKDVSLMKKYMTPELSELFNLEDVLADSDLDNVGGDPAGNDGFDEESEGFELIAD